MKAQVTVDVDDVIDGLSYSDTVELAKMLSRQYLDVKEQVETILESGYTYDEILNCIDTEIIENYVETN